MSERKQEGLPDEISEKHKSGCLNKYESIRKDPAHDEGENKTVNHSKQQKVDPSEDPLHSKKRDIDSVPCLSSKNLRVLLQAILVARRDTKLSIEDIIQSLGLSKIKSDILKTVIERCREKESINRDRVGNIRGEIQPSSNVIFASRRYVNNTNSYADIQNALPIAFDNVIASGCNTHKFKDPFLHAQRENGLQPFRYFLVAPDGDGDNDPECTKLAVDSKPLGRSSSLVAPVRYLIKLGTKKEIQTEVLTKEENFVDISKTIKSSIDKLSWDESEENDIDTYRSEEEEGNEDLTSAYPHYCGGEIGDMIDQSVTCDLDDDNMQQFNDAQAVEAEENESQDDEDAESVSNDSSSEPQEDGGGGMLLEDTVVSAQIRLTSEGVIVEEKSAVHSDHHELAGTGQTNPIDYALQQSELVGKQPHQFMCTWSDTTGTKHYLLTNGSSITVTTNEVIANLTVNSTLQDSSQEQPIGNHLLCGDNWSSNEGENSAVEQASEPPSTYLSLEQAALPPLTMENYPMLQFPQPEDQPTPLSDQVDTPTELPEEPYTYFDATEAKPEEDSEEIENYPVPSFVSSPAENVDDQSEEIHIERRRRSPWSNCRLL